MSLALVYAGFHVKANAVFRHKCSPGIKPSNPTTAVILGAAGNPVRKPREAQISPLSLEGRGLGRGDDGMSIPVCHGLISPNGESLLALPKSNQKASPYCPPDPPVLALCGMRQRHTNASLSLRRVCADDASTTAQHCALRGGQKGRSKQNLHERVSRTAI